MKKAFVVFTLVCAVFLAQFLGIGLTVVKAADLTPVVVRDTNGDIISITYPNPVIEDFITDLALNKISPNETEALGDDVPKNGEFRVTYSFSIPQNSDLLDEDYFILDLPSYMEVPSDVNNVDIYDSIFGYHVLTVHMRQGIGSNGQDGILVEFTNELELHTADHAFSGAFWFEANFDADEVGKGGAILIEFDNGRAASPYTQTIDFDWDNAEFTKSNNYSSSNPQALYDSLENCHEITWTLDINPNGVHMGDNVVITDVIDTTWMEYVDTPLDLTNPANVTQTIGSAAYTVVYDDITHTLTISFLESVTTHQAFSYVTKILPNAYIDNLSDSNNTLSVTNNASMQVPDENDDLVTNNSTVSYTIDVVDKSLDESAETGIAGGVDYTNSRIHWVVIANPNGYEVNDAYVTDILDADFTMDETTIRFEFMESGIVYSVNDLPFANTPLDNTDIDFSSTGNTYRFDLGNISEPVRISYEVSIPDVYYTQENEEFTNIVYFHPPAGDVNNAGEEVGVPITSEVISKTRVANHYTDVETASIDWQIVINPNADSHGVVLQDLYVWDTLPTGFVLHDPNGDGDYSDAFTISNDLSNNINDEVAGAAITYDEPSRTIYINFDPDNTRNMDTTAVDADPALNRDAIAQTYTIEFTSDVAPGYEYLYKRNQNQSFSNDAHFESYNAGAAYDRAWGYLGPQVVTKFFDDYNYDNHFITWEVEVNYSRNDLYNPIFTDYIPEGMQYVADSFALKDERANTDLDFEANGGYVTYTPYAPGTQLHPDTVNHPGEYISGKLEYTFFPKSGDIGYSASNFITDDYYIYFQTEFVDMDILSENYLDDGNTPAVTVNNDGYLTHDEDNGEIIRHVEPTDFTSSVIEKGPEYTSGEQYIDWVITINKNQVDILGPDPDPYPGNDYYGPVIYDTLQEGLVIDLESIVLYEASVDSNGDVNIDPDGDGTDNEIPFDTEQIQIDSNRQLTFEFADDILASQMYSCYQIKFRTYIEAGYRRANFDNTASFRALTGEPNVTSDNQAVNFAIGGGYAAANIGHLKIKKVDSESGLPLQGAIFELTDSQGRVVDTKETDADGIALFEFIFFDRDYWYREAQAPYGYSADTTTTTYFMIDSATATDEGEDDPDRTYEPAAILNDADPITVQLYKQDGSGAGLQGALFYIYESGSPQTIVAQAASDAVGLVTFANLPANRIYEIIEASPPLGYLPDPSNPPILTVICTVGDVPFQPTPNILVNIADDTAHSIIVFMKYAHDGSTPLQGCEFGLYSTAVPDFLLATATSQENGIVEFTNIPAGSYIVRELNSPDGYLVSDTQLTVTVGDTAAAYPTTPNTLTNYLTPLGNPRTGEKPAIINLTLIISIAAMIIIGCGSYIQIMRKRKK